jgi:TrmH family RNA methyltransferase
MILPMAGQPHARGSQHDRLRLIEGRHNALLKELRRAFSHADATEDGYHAIEGVRMIEEAIRSGLRLKAVFFSKSAESRAERLLPQLGAHVETILLPDKLFATAVATDTPQGIAALVRLKDFALEDVLQRAEFGPVLAIDGLQDPGNLGTILRSGEAFGAAGLVLGQGTVSPLNPKAVRASAGSVFRLPFANAELNSAIEPMRERGLRLIATSSHKGVDVASANLAGPAVIFLGNEGAGLDRNLLSRMDELVAIPHSSQVESLNAGMAASIILYEVARQRALSESTHEGPQPPP